MLLHAHTIHDTFGILEKEFVRKLKCLNCMCNNNKHYLSRGSESTLHRRSSSLWYIVGSSAIMPNLNRNMKL